MSAKPKRIHRGKLTCDQFAAQRREDFLRDKFAGDALRGIVDRVLFDNRFEKIFLKGCKTKKAKRAKVAQLPAFCASIAYDVADAMLRERHERDILF